MYVSYSKNTIYKVNSFKTLHYISSFHPNYHVILSLYTSLCSLGSVFLFPPFFETIRIPLLCYNCLYLELIRTLSVRNALIFILTHQTVQIPPQHVFQSEGDHTRKENKIKQIS